MGSKELEVVNTDTQPVGQYDRILELAIQQDAPLDQLEKWMSLKERYESQEAKKAYHDAMTQFKAHPPVIIKDKTVGYQAQGKTVGYSHASLANVTATISAELSKYGLSAAWKTDQSESGIKVTCSIMHRMGHSESTSLTAAPDNSGSKNSIQAIGSTITYLERYTLLALTGLATHDQDDDGTGAAPQEYITIDQQTQISDMIGPDSGPMAKKWLKWIEADDVAHILKKDYNRFIIALNQAKNQKGGAK